MDFWQFLDSGTPYILAALGVIGWWVRRTLNNTTTIVTTQAVHEERLNKHEKRHDKTDEKLDEYGNRISALEHPNLHPHPRASSRTGHP